MKLDLEMMAEDPPRHSAESHVITGRFRRDVEDIYERILRGDRETAVRSLEWILFDHVGDNEIKIRVKRDLDAKEKAA